MTNLIKTIIFSPFFIVFFCIPILSLGQKHFEEGYVVLNNNDTLFGALMDRKPHPFGSLYKKIKFRGEKKKRKYGPKQILAYNKGQSVFESVWITDSGDFFNQNYTSVQGYGEPVFLKVVEKGFLTHYHWEFEDADSGYIDYTAYFKKEDNPYLVRVNQGVLGLKRKNLAKFFSDCPPLAQKIANKEFKTPSEIVQFYNEWKENQETVKN